MITGSGGSGTYTFTLTSAIGGSVSPASGSYTVFTPGSMTGTATLNVTDSSGNTTTGTIYVTGSGGGTGTLVLSPSGGSVAASGALNMTVTGGTAPYSWTVSSGGGYFTSASTSSTANTYYAPSTTQTVSVQVSDSAGNFGTATIYVSGTSATTSSCSGNFNMNLAGTAASLTVVQDASGNIGGYISISGSYAPIAGTCSAGTINFTNLYSGSPFTGSYFVNPSSNTLAMTGTFSYAGGTYNWIATQ